MLLAPPDPRADAGARRVREGLAGGAEGGGGRALPGRVEELYDADESLWPALGAAFRADFRALDRLLLRLHYQRGAVADPGRRERVLRFLTLGYALSGDVRYLNEFLWFGGGEAGGYGAVNRLTFGESVGTDGCHRFPLAGPEALARGVEALTAHDAPPGPPRLPERVAVLGPPHAFSALYAALRREGCEPAVYDFPPPGRGWSRRLKAHPLVRRAYYAARRCRVPYRAVPHPPASDEAGRMVAEAGCAVAVHQLPFIIRANLIGALPGGILNDHLGVLPFVRGRSSLEFSLLHGLPPAATVHRVDKGVDTGPLLRGYVYAAEGAPSVQALKAHVLRRQDARLLDVLRYLGGGGRRTLANPPEQGLQYFTMHPELVRWLDARVLPHLAGKDAGGRG
ncbi:MAG TPA: formyltransferase family protein [Longimicrobium sp.]|nr:formyltransferase family protein [Longimicrobium sp.]